MTTGFRTLVLIKEDNKEEEIAALAVLAESDIYLHDVDNCHNNVDFNIKKTYVKIEIKVGNTKVEKAQHK